MNELLADWTTDGPYRQLSWVTIVFTVIVILTLLLALVEFHDAYKNYKAVIAAEKNGALEVLAVNSIFKSVGRILIQLCFLVLAFFSILLSVKLTVTHLYWYRVVFILSFIGAEIILWLLVINDIISRHKLEILIARYYKEEEQRERN